MRQEEQQVSNDHPEAVRSAAGAGAASGRPGRPAPTYPRTPSTTGAPSTSRPSPTADRTNAHRTGRRVRPGRRRRAAGTPTGPRPDDRDADRRPGRVPRAGAAADRLRGHQRRRRGRRVRAWPAPCRQDEPDPRTESTARPGDGAVGGPREGRRADPTAEFHRPRRASATTGPTTGGPPGRHRVLPPDAADGRPRAPGRRHRWAGDPEAARPGGRVRQRHAGRWSTRTPSTRRPRRDGHRATLGVRRHRPAAGLDGGRRTGQPLRPGRRRRASGTAGATSSCASSTIPAPRPVRPSRWSRRPSRPSPRRCPRRRTSWAAGRTPAPPTPSSSGWPSATTATSWTGCSGR